MYDIRSPVDQILDRFPSQGVPNPGTGIDFPGAQGTEIPDTIFIIGSMGFPQGEDSYLVP